MALLIFTMCTDPDTTSRDRISNDVTTSFPRQDWQWAFGCTRERTPFMSERYFTHTLNMVSKDVATIYGPNECIETV